MLMVTNNQDDQRVVTFSVQNIETTEQSPYVARRVESWLLG